MKKLLAVLAVCYLSPCAMAQNKAISVHVAATSQDQLGKQLASALRERIRDSKTYEEEFDAAEATYGIKLVTLDPDDSASQNRTIYAWTLVTNLGAQKSMYVTSSVGICGRTSIDDCAGNLYRDMGVQVDWMKQALVEELRSRARQ